MYIINDVCYAGNLEKEIKITEAKPLAGKMILATFSTGEQRLFDATRLTEAAFQPLTDEAVFRDIRLFHGAITWLDGAIDIAPETVYRDSYPYDAVSR
ncbi:MAG: DUF2442 domain-containing protein [Schwartzia sp.]|nr:DUF2442 domain-containing protein [Schwartzia sp. (in: firmicutes)]